MDFTIPPHVIALIPPTMMLRDGTIGWHVRVPRTDDCFQAAVATALQVGIAEVPDSNIDARLLRGDSPQEITRSTLRALERWLSERGLRMVTHRWLPEPRPSRWIGICPGGRGWFDDHCLVMAGEEMLFDPTCFIGGTHFLGPQDVRWGYSFTRV